MLMSLGPLAFEVWPFNAHETRRETEASHVEKPVMGRRPPLEFVGDGPDRQTITGRLFPETLGGMSGLTILDRLRSTGIAQPLMRGDGTPLGWFVVERVTERGEYLDHRGVPRKIEFEISLRRSDAPFSFDLISTLVSLFG